MNTPQTLGEALAARRSSTKGINFIEGEGVARRLRYADLHARASGLLRHLQRAGATAGSELLIVVERNEQFIDAFWAGILGNIILVPVAPGTNDEHRLKFFRVLAQLQRPCLCTDSAILGRLSAFAAAHRLDDALARVRTTTVLLDRIDDISQPGAVAAAQADDVAFVQFSSGSTSEPKGVALTHRNLLTNIDAIAGGVALGGSDTGLSWMPLTHDMGLIGFHLTPLVYDVEQFLMPTALFVRRPQLWLTEAAARHASILCSPNFGFRHFLRAFKPESFAGCDLSAVRVLFNGAEPISAALCEEFARTMATYGLTASAMFPVYGLAEASLAVTFPPTGTGCNSVSLRRDRLLTGAPVEPAAPGDAGAAPFVVLGRPVAGCEVRIADETGAALTAGTVGRVLIRGDNVTHGYYGNPAATQAAIRDGWLDTGDLGFFSDGGLVITGRAKDILFVSGQNYYPHDLEAVIETHAGVELGKAAVCGARAAGKDADEVLVFVQHRGDLDAFLPLANAIRRVVNEVVGVPVDAVIPVARIPKTTSGKTQRYKLADAYLQGEFAEPIARLQALTGTPANASAAGALGEIERNLKAICDALLPDKKVGAHDNIFELGTSSLTLAQIYERIEAIYPGQLEVTDFFDYPTIAELASYLQKRLQDTQA